jgi:hypothetical protein
MQLDLAIEPLCSSSGPFGHKGMHCQGAVDATGSSIMWYLYSCGSTLWRGSAWRMGGWGKGLIVEVIEPFKSSSQTTRQGQHVQRGLVSPSIANSHL